jgi:hypothetical protein
MWRKRNEAFAERVIQYYVNITSRHKSKTVEHFKDEVKYKTTLYHIISRFEERDTIEYKKIPGRSPNEETVKRFLLPSASSGRIQISPSVQRLIKWNYQINCKENKTINSGLKPSLLKLSPNTMKTRSEERKQTAENLRRNATRRDLESFI